MKRNIVRRMLVNLSFAVVLAALLPAAYGQSCSLARAAGTYGLTNSGTVVGIGPRTAVGVWTMDAAGNLTNGKATSSMNGTIFQIRDPSGNLLFTVTTDAAWDDNMQQVRFIFTSVVAPNGTALETVINGDARKLSTENQQ